MPSVEGVFCRVDKKTCPTRRVFVLIRWKVHLIWRFTPIIKFQIQPMVKF